MKTIFSLLLIAACFSVQAQKDSTAGKLFRKATDWVDKNKGKGSVLSTEEVIAGLKEALTVGAGNSATLLSAADGFFANAAIKVLMPPEARKVETTLRNVGMGSYVDKAILSMNRAAEDASQAATPIFKEAIRTMTFQDAMGILRGADTAATGYLRSRTSGALTTAFRPVIEESLRKTQATQYWKDVFETYNKLPTTFNKVNPDLAGYVTERALFGLFYQVAIEEKKIRKDPAARVTDVLKKVFSN